jgi:hypothetical protein
MRAIKTYRKVGFSEKSRKSGDRKCPGDWEKSFGVPALFAISGMNNVDSARSAIPKSLGSQAGAFITVSPV